MKPIFVTAMLLCLALSPSTALAEEPADPTYAPTPSGDGGYPCVVIDWNHLVVGIREDCWSP